MVLRLMSLAIAVMATALAGCAANKTIPVTSNPDGATVYVDGRKIGTTPIHVTMDDLLPTRAADGKLSSTAKLSIEKDGYKDWQITLEEWSVPNTIQATLESKPISQHYEDYSKHSPGILDATLVPAGPPVILVSQNLDADSDGLFARGFVLIGFAGIAGEGVTKEQISRQAETVGAAVAVVQSRLTHVQTEMRAVTVHTPGRVANDTCVNNVLYCASEVLDETHRKPRRARTSPDAGAGLAQGRIGARRSCTTRRR